jgi:DNA-binding NtrC family response regulator
MRRDVVLVVDDDARLRATLGEVLSPDYDVVEASMVKTGKLRVDQGCDAVLLDIRFGSDPANQDGLALLEEIAADHPGLPVIMMTGHADMAVALRSLKAGAADFIQKDSFEPRQLPTVVARAIQRSRDQRRTEVLERRLQALETSELVGSSTAMKEVRRQVDMVAADASATLLVTGETGTGKELAARMVHGRGSRRQGPFVAVRTASMGTETIEAEMFGAASLGAGAPSVVGLVEQASSGVLFIDGISDLPMGLQGRVLRLLEAGVSRRMGGGAEIRVDVQVIASTSVDLRALVDAGQFRQDLYFRLKSFEIRMPALREMPGDVVPLAEQIVHEFRHAGRTRVHGISEAAIDCLRKYHFPGNVRELRSILERAVIMSESRGRRRVEPDDLPAELRGFGQAPALAALRWQADAPISMDAELAWIELLAIDVALERSGGRKQAAGGLLGLPHRHALPRRVARIRRDHPQLLERCPRVAEAFAPGEEGGES